MRFRRWLRLTAYEDTPRKRTALARTQRRQRESLPLFRDLIAERQPSIDAEMARRAEWWPRMQQESRDRRARDWRRARRRLAEYGDNLRRLIVRLWCDCPYPADPCYLLDLLHDIDAGRVDPHQPPWEYPEAPAPRTTPNPVTFDEAFRRIGQRKVGGDLRRPRPTSSPSWAISAAGSSLITSRVRLIELLESFYTSSGHRLRDSHVGRSGHWVDIQVRGICSDADLALVERLAQALDRRPVVVRRAGEPAVAQAGRAAGRGMVQRKRRQPVRMTGFDAGREAPGHPSGDLTHVERL
jgi:hypothetical protein